MGSTWVRGQGVKDQARVGGGLIDSRSMLKMMGGGVENKSLGRAGSSSYVCWPSSGTGLHFLCKELRELPLKNHKMSWRRRAL